MAADYDGVDMGGKQFDLLTGADAEAGNQMFAGRADVCEHSEGLGVDLGMGAGDAASQGYIDRVDCGVTQPSYAIGRCGGDGDRYAGDALLSADGVEAFVAFEG